MTFLVGRPCPLRYSTLELSLTLSTVFLALVMRSLFLLQTISWSFHFDCYGTSNCQCSRCFLFSDVAASFVFFVFRKSSSLSSSSSLLNSLYLVPCLAVTFSLQVLFFGGSSGISSLVPRFTSPRFQLALVSLPPFPGSTAAIRQRLSPAYQRH